MSAETATIRRNALCVLGASSVMAQTLAAREILALVGGLEISLGLILFAWLIWAGCGAWAAGRRRAFLADANTILAGGAAGECWLGLAGILLVRKVALWCLGDDGMIPGIHQAVFMVLLVAAPAAANAGFTLSYALRGMDHDGGGRPLFWDAMAGSAAGAGYSLFLAGQCSNMETACWMAVAGSFFMVAAQPAGRITPVLKCTAAGILALCGAGLWFLDIPGKIDRRTMPFHGKRITGGETLLRFHDTRYQRLLLTRYEDQCTVYANGDPLLSYPDKENDRIAGHFAANLIVRPRRILIAGGFGRSILAPMLRYQPDAIDLVEFDGGLIPFVAPLLDQEDRDALQHPAVHLFSMDLARFFMETHDAYDLVWLHLPPPASLMANRFYTTTFYRKIANMLAPDGVLVFGALGAPNYVGEELGNYLGMLHVTLQRVFPAIIELPGAQEIFIAGKHRGAIPGGPREMVRRFRSRFGEGSSFQPEVFHLLWEPDRVAQRTRALRPWLAGLSPNLDLAPKTILAYMRVWGRLQEDGLFGLDTLLQTSSMWLWIFLGAGNVLVLLVHRQATRAGKGIGWSQVWIAGAGGAAGMMMEIIVLFVYQTACGHVFAHMAMLFGGYILGFAAGCVLASGMLARGSASAVRIVQHTSRGILACLALTWIMTGVFRDALSPRLVAMVFPGMLIMFSTFLGLQLPALIAWRGQARGHYMHGHILGADYLAGAFAALLGSVIIIPWAGPSQAAGMTLCCVLTACVLAKTGS